MNFWQTIKRPPWRTVFAGGALLLGLGMAYAFWTPGLDLRDGRYDRGRNGIWIAHGWLGADQWFIQYRKTNEFVRYRDPERIRELAAKFRRHHITDVFPHLCPADSTGKVPAVNAVQVERFLDEFTGFRVLPWLGGPNGNDVRLDDEKWRAQFVSDVRALLSTHPRLAGVQVNVEPLPSGDTNFLKLLTELRAALPAGKLLSIAAYPPPTVWHRFPEVHWEEAYFREVARHSDQMAVMAYDAGQNIPKTYQKLMADWTEEILAWSEGKEVLIGVPTYADADVAYHDPRVENLINALLGIHRGLSRRAVPLNYRGVAIYCEWEMDDGEWHHFTERFLKR
jgi:hypothetical protein